MCNISPGSGGITASLARPISSASGHNTDTATFYSLLVPVPGPLVVETALRRRRRVRADDAAGDGIRRDDFRNTKHFRERRGREAPCNFDGRRAVDEERLGRADLAPPDVFHLSVQDLESVPHAVGRRERQRAATPRGAGRAASRRDLARPVRDDRAGCGRRPLRELGAVKRRLGRRRQEADAVLLLVQDFERARAAERAPRELGVLFVAVNNRDFPIDDPIAARVDRGRVPVGGTRAWRLRAVQDGPEAAVLVAAASNAPDQFSARPCVQQIVGLGSARHRGSQQHSWRGRDDAST